MIEFDNIVGDKLQSIEIKPSTGLFERIEKSLVSEEGSAVAFENVVGDKLNEVRITPSRKLFARIEETLARSTVATTTVTRRFRVAQLWNYAAVAAVAAIAVVFAVRDNNRMTELPLKTGSGLIINNKVVATANPVLPVEPNRASHLVSNIIQSATHSASPEVLYAEVVPEEREADVTADDIANRILASVSNSSHRQRNSVVSNWWDEIRDNDNGSFIARAIRNSSAALYGGNLGLLTGDVVKTNTSQFISSGRMGAPRRDESTAFFGDRNLSIADRLVEEELTHKMPVTFGLSVSFRLIDRVSVATGLNYTYLKSISKNTNLLSNNESSMMRELYYIGIPVSLTYVPYQNKYWSFYLSAGGQLEKAVYARLTEQTKYPSGIVSDRERITVNGIQPSINLSAGVMFNITNWLGLYVEPGAAYYFNTGQPANYRAVNPITFSLQIGLNFNWK